jgi:hypothetical protein
VKEMSGEGPIGIIEALLEKEIQATAKAVSAAA